MNKGIILLSVAVLFGLSGCEWFGKKQEPTETKQVAENEMNAGQEQVMNEADAQGTLVAENGVDGAGMPAETPAMTEPAAEKPVAPAMEEPAAAKQPVMPETPAGEPAMSETPASDIK